MPYKFRTNIHADIIFLGNEAYNLGYEKSATFGIPIVLWIAERRWTGKNLFENLKFGRGTELNHDLRERVNNDWMELARNVPQEYPELNMQLALHRLNGFGDGGGSYAYDWTIDEHCLRLSQKKKLANSNAKEVLVLRERDLESFVRDYRRFISRNRDRFQAVPRWMNTILRGFKDLG